MREHPLRHIHNLNDSSKSFLAAVLATLIVGAVSFAQYRMRSSEGTGRALVTSEAPGIFERLGYAFREGGGDKLTASVAEVRSVGEKLNTAMQDSSDPLNFQNGAPVRSIDISQ